MPLTVGSYFVVVKEDPRHVGAPVGTYGKILGISDSGTKAEVRAFRKNGTIGGGGWIPLAFIDAVDAKDEEWLRGADIAYDAMLNGMVKHSEEQQALHDAALERVAERTGLTFSFVKHLLHVYEEEWPA